MKKKELPNFPKTSLFLGRPKSASIIIDNYNYAKYIGDAIQSALAQTYPAQVIVVDDGSTDNSRDIIKSFGERIEIVFKSNGGHASAFNAGFIRAKGDIVMFLDSDDMMEPHAVATVLKSWCHGTVLAHYPMTIINAEGNSRGVMPGFPAQLADGDVRKELLTVGGCASTVTSGMAFARNILDCVMPIPEKIFLQAADGYLLRAVSFFGYVQFIDSKLARYRIHERNDSDPIRAIGNQAAGFRKKINYSRNEFDTIRQFAEKFNLPAASNLGEQDPDYLGNRLFSLILNPADHPIKNDRRLLLLYRYVIRRLLSSWSLRRRVFAILIAIAATFSTPGFALILLRWLHDSNSQPQWFRNLGNWLRRKSFKGLASSSDPISKII